MARWHSCNVLQSGQEFHNLWQFAAGSKFALQLEETKRASEPLPDKVIGKDWQTLFQPKLNVALLPTEKVFLRVVQLPKADYAETKSMVELQLEKLSPLPVAQVVWGFELLSASLPETQTVVVIMVARAYVEEYLNVLEGQGFMADRLELPFLDLLRATNIKGDGAWVYTRHAGDRNCCLVAWWYYGTLQNLALVRLPPGSNNGAAFQQQLTQMMWAGEYEGWLVSTPRYHIVGPEEPALLWKSYFTPDQAVEISAPLAAADLAALTAKRAATEELSTNLLPPEYATRYKQQFVDRLWMRGIGAVIMVYVVLAALYIGWAQFEKWRYTRVESRIADLGLSYTNAIRLKDKVRVLQEQRDLQFAALDCWKAVADSLPSELTLNSLNFDGGRKILTLMGTAASDDVAKVQDFNDAMRKMVVKQELLFSNVKAPTIIPMPGAQQINWSFGCELKRSDLE